MTLVTPVITELPDRTAELSFDGPTQECVDALMADKVAVIKGAIGAEALRGAARAVKLNFYSSIHRRIYAKAVGRLEGADSPRAVELRHALRSGFRTETTPWLLRSSLKAIKEIEAVNDELFGHAEIAERYEGSQALNEADIARSRGSRLAFNKHQDSMGLSGLGYSAIPLDTRWFIHAWGRSPADYDYRFDTEAGDLVVVAGRSGPCPDYVPPAQGCEVYFEDGSVVHSGYNLTDQTRYRLALFHQDLSEGARS